MERAHWSRWRQYSQELSPIERRHSEDDVQSNDAGECHGGHDGRAPRLPTAQQSTEHEGANADPGTQPPDDLRHNHRAILKRIRARERESESESEEPRDRCEVVDTIERVERWEESENRAKAT